MAEEENKPTEEAAAPAPEPTAAASAPEPTAAAVPADASPRRPGGTRCAQGAPRS